MATLTHAELATLLGSPPANEIHVAHIPIAGTDRWTKFSDQFARSLSARLRPLVRAAARVQSSSAMSIKAEAIHLSSGQPALAEVWQTPSLDDPSAVTLSLPLVTAFVDRLLGGGSGSIADSTNDPRALSDTDRRLASRLVEAIRQSFIEAIQDSDQVESFRLERSSTTLSDAWLPDCELLRLAFDVRFVQGSGSFDLMLPVDFAERLADEPTGSASTQHHGPASPTQRSSQRIGLSHVTVRLAQTSLPVSDFHNLAVGDVLLTEAEPGQPCEVLINGRCSFRADPGQCNDHKAARLLQAIPEIAVE